MIRTLRWRQLSVNVLVMLATLLAIFVVLEVTARIALRGQSRRGKEQRERATYTVFDPVLGWRLRPGAHVRYDRGEYDTDVAINSLGMRDRERTITPDPGTFRILALGDSFVEGYTVNFQDTVSQVIERGLSSPSCPVEVLNAGAGGYSTDQEYLFYRENGRRLGARLVLLFFFHNDLEALLEKSYYGAPKPVFAYHRRSGLTLRTDHVVEPPARPEAQPPPLPPRSGPWFRSTAWGLLKYRLITGAPRIYDGLARWGLWEPLDRMPVYPELKAFRVPPPPRVRGSWINADQLLAALKRDVEADGAELVVVYVPSRMEVDDADWEATRIRHALRPGRWSREAVVRRLEKSGRQGGFQVLDLTPALRAATGPFRKTYLAFDRHWNARGHQVAAEAVAAYLRSARLLPDCVPPR